VEVCEQKCPILFTTDPSILPQIDERTVTVQRSYIKDCVTSQEEGDCPATLQHAAPHCSSVHGKDSELLPHPPYSLDLAALILLSLHVRKCVASTV